MTGYAYRVQVKHGRGQRWNDIVRPGWAGDTTRDVTEAVELAEEVFLDEEGFAAVRVTERPDSPSMGGRTAYLLRAVR